MEPEQARLLGASGSTALDPELCGRFALPLLETLRDWGQEARQGLRRLPVIGLNGPVGAGKSTLGRQLEAMAPHFGLKLTVASIDDLYLGWPERGVRLAGNPFGVNRVPPGSHDLSLLLRALRDWRAGGTLRLPRFDKTLAGGEGDRRGWREEPCDALVLEGWLIGCRPLDDACLDGLISAPRTGEQAEPRDIADPGQDRGVVTGGPRLNAAEWLWLPHWNRELEAYLPLWQAMDALWVLRPLSWSLPRRWRFQAEARQRRRGGGWLPAESLNRLVRASLCSLPPELYQDPLIADLPKGTRRGVTTGPWAGHAAPRSAREPEPGSRTVGCTVNPAGKEVPVGAVAWLDGRRRCRGSWLQASASASSSATG